MKTGAWILAPAAAALFVCAMIAARWDGPAGFAGLLRFGSNFAARRLPELAGFPIPTVQGAGYDGQFYAQLAVSPHPRNPSVQSAMDDPPYRSRRILLSWVAHLLGAGRPWAVLQVFALLNLAVWLALGCLLWKELSPLPNHEGALCWLCCMLTLGALDSVRLGLTDLTVVLLIALAAREWRKGHPWRGVAMLALAGLTRETGLAAGTLAADTERPWKKAWVFALRLTAAALPLIAWASWLKLSLPPTYSTWTRTVDWPGIALVRHVLRCASSIYHGSLDSRDIFGLAGAATLAYQSITLLSKPDWSSPWWRAGLGFALLFWILGDQVWSGYWAAARVVLPLTFAYNLTLPRSRPWLLLPNLPLVLHGLWRLIP